jgi:hypothetical protein
MLYSHMPTFFSILSFFSIVQYWGLVHVKQIPTKLHPQPCFNLDFLLINEYLNFRIILFIIIYMAIFISWVIRLFSRNFFRKDLGQLFVWILEYTHVYFLPLYLNYPFVMYKTLDHNCFSGIHFRHYSIFSYTNDYYFWIPAFVFSSSVRKL